MSVKLKYIEEIPEEALVMPARVHCCNSIMIVQFFFPFYTFQAAHNVQNICNLQLYVCAQGGCALLNRLNIIHGLIIFLFLMN